MRLSFDQPLPKGQPQTVTFFYDGRLTGQEDSPVYGIKFAAIHPDYAYLLYPARWFPVNGYTTDRFAADMQHHGADGLQGDRQRPRQQADGGRQDDVHVQVRAAVFPGQHRGGERRPGAGAAEGRHHHALFPRAGSGDGAGLRRGDRQDDDLLHRAVRPAAVRQPDGGGDGKRRAQRLRRARPALPDAARHRHAGESQAAGQPDLAAVVRRAGFARHAQSPVADQRPGGYSRDAVDGARRTARARWSGSTANLWWKRSRSTTCR